MILMKEFKKENAFVDLHVSLTLGIRQEHIVCRWLLMFVCFLLKLNWGNQ